MDTSMDLQQYRASDAEQNRTKDLMRLIRLMENSQNALDIGARDGYFSKLMLESFSNVTALDLEKPNIPDENIECVKGDITDLQYDDNSFDLIFCAEVLEHIPTQLLEKACAELSRASRRYLLIGVPYKQDIRLNRTTCYSCGKLNPPWGHVNSFDENRLKQLFSSYTVKEMSFVGESTKQTNFVSAALMNLAGNPYGTYEQEEPCVHCNEKLKKPPARNLIQKVFTKLAFIGMSIQKPFISPHGNWIHILLEKKSSDS